MSPIIDNCTKMQFKSQLRVEHQTRNTLDNMAVANKKRNTWSPLLRAIECPACLELLTGNIQICRNGHSLCSKCRNAVQFCPLCRGLFTKMRNYTLEALVALFEYPCKYAEEGCETYLKKAEIADHQRNCVYRTYRCMILKNDGGKCNWIGLPKDMHEHALSVHPERAWMQEDNLDRWKPGTDADDEVNLVAAFDNLFYLTRQVHNEVMYWCLNLIGPEDDAKFYSLQMEFLTRPNSPRSIAWSDICQTIDTSPMSLISKGLSFGLPKTVIRTFKYEANGVWFKVQIVKSNQPQETLVSTSINHSED